MIKLVVKEYCHNCPNFEAVTDKALMCDGDAITIVSCEHCEKCEKIAKYMGAEIKGGAE